MASPTSDATTGHPPEHSPSQSEAPSSPGSSPPSSLDDALPSLPADVDGNEEDSIAICGLSFKFPAEATSENDLWEMLLNKRCASTEIPANRFSIGGFSRNSKAVNTLAVKQAHFIEEDVSAFDAGFFSMSPAEASSTDPMQRWLLETSFRAMENAGIPMEDFSGSLTSVFTGCFGSDYTIQLYRDAEQLPPYAATGLGFSMLSNRISWFYNLKGPSVTLDSACSSSLLAVDMACQSLRSGASNMSLVAGSNLTFAPETFLSLNNASMLSPDGRCYSFDERANGYARGEGVAVVILKRLSDAIRDGNTIRAVIRATGSGEDGRTPTITQPSSEAQQQLIAETYRRANLLTLHTRYVETHGTGTAVGDPNEARAIGQTLGRSPEDPVYIGAIKSNIGHLEGASGLAGVIKTVLVLEKGIIPPNTNFQQLNHRIDSKALGLSFPTESTPWPSHGLRRASVNSFGYGGAISHVVLDDAYNYLRLRGLSGIHKTAAEPVLSGNLTAESLIPSTKGDPNVRLYVWSSADKDGLARIAQDYEVYATKHMHRLEANPPFMSDLAHTLSNHRCHLPWRGFALLSSVTDLSRLTSSISQPQSAFSSPPELTFVFTGQGAQWHAMGRELIRFPEFRSELVKAGEFLRSLGCDWSVLDEMMLDEESSRINQPDRSQTITTILQVALVRLVSKFGVRPSTVVGHSSGEIAAAYAGGYLSSESAWRLAYFRGVCAAQVAQSDGPRGAMASVGMSEKDAEAIIAKLRGQEPMAGEFGIAVACMNSPSNVTIAGEESLVDSFIRSLDDDVFARKLKVGVAYHSEQMKPAAASLESMTGTLTNNHEFDHVPMISSVTGQRASAARLLEPSYWALNMTSPVRFYQAVSEAVTRDAEGNGTSPDSRIKPASHFVEIGPHAALQGLIRSTIQSLPGSEASGYSSLLKRRVPANETLLQAMGHLYSIGFPVDLHAINELLRDDSTPSSSMLTDLPEYPFDHSRHYWHEGRLSRNYRQRQYAPSELLGVRARDWDPANPQWHHFINTAEMTWAEQHVVGGSCLYPAAGMLAMAIEAAKQLAEPSNTISAFTLRDVEILAPIDLTAGNGVAEVKTTLRAPDSSKSTTWQFDMSTMGAGEHWVKNCRGFIHVELSEQADDWTKSRTESERKHRASMFSDMYSQCVQKVDVRNMYALLKNQGLEYGPAFQAAIEQRCHQTEQRASARVSLFKDIEEEHVVHPTSLDAIFHLVFTALTFGGSQPLVTSVPYRIGSMWISAKGLSCQDAEDLGVCMAVTKTTDRGFFCHGAALDDISGSQNLKLWVSDVEVRNISDNTASTLEVSSTPPFCMQVDCKVALNKLGFSETRQLLERRYNVEEESTQVLQQLEFVIVESLKQLLQITLPAESNEPWKRNYLEWASDQLQERKRPQEDWGKCTRASERQLKEARQMLRTHSKWGVLYAEISQSLLSIFQGDDSPLDMMLQSDVFGDYYDECANYRAGKVATDYMDLLAHQTPGLNILEVGGGTGSGARNIINGLRSGPDAEHTTLRCSRYDFTDVSPTFLEIAKQEFSSFESQMSFKTLDITQDLVAQGFEESFYDVVIAVSALHVTPDLAQSLRNARKVLKPGGRLVIQESFQPSGWTLGFIFGLFPGWWVGKDDGRPLSPNLSVEAWDDLLKKCGFNGADMVFKDVEGNKEHKHGWIVSTAAESVEPKPTIGGTSTSSKDLVIVMDETSKQQTLLYSSIKSSLGEMLGSDPTTMSLEAATRRQRGSAGEFVVFLLDYDSKPFLENLNETKWKALQLFVPRLDHILWISLGGGRNPSPGSGLLDGFSRTLREENYDLHLVMLGLHGSENQSLHDQAYKVIQIAQEMVSRRPQAPYEQAYVDIDGLLHTQRLVDATHVSSAVHATMQPYRTEATQLSGEVRFKTAELGQSIDKQLPTRLVRTQRPHELELCRDDVEIAVAALNLQAQDVVSVPNLQEDGSFSRYCSGKVVRAGPDSSFKPGDSVFATCFRAFQSHVQVPSRDVVKLQGDQSPADACSTIVPILTACHLLGVAGTTPAASDSILINGIGGALGLAILAVLESCGVSEIWVTADSEANAGWVHDRLHIPNDRIIPVAWLEEQPMLLSHLQSRLSTVLTLTEATPPRLFLGYLRHGGRLIISRSKRSSGPSSKTLALELSQSRASVHIVDPADLRPTADHIQDAAAISNGFSRSMTDETAQFRVSEMASATAHVRTKPEGEVVLTFDEEDTVDLMIENTVDFKFNPEGTYLIAGAFGGVGRGAAAWLVSRGARHLILLSRSGPRTPEAHKLLEDLEKDGVQVQVACCDVSDRAVLRSTLDKYASSMPPIRGCIQATIVLTEAIFDKMTFEEWQASIDPKATAARNLHMELPPDLDFFVMTSSAMGWLGRASLVGYNAGNTYQEALARHRVANGQHGVSLNLGGVIDSGYLTEHKDRMSAITSDEKLYMMTMGQIYALFDLYCSPKAKSQLLGIGGSAACCPIFGILPPSYWKHKAEVPQTMLQPLWSHMNHMPLPANVEDRENAVNGINGADRRRAQDTASRLTAAKTREEAAEVISDGLADRVSSLLGIDKDHMDSSRPMHSYGIDSLSAIYIRNWVNKVFGVSITVLDILGKATFASTGASIAESVDTGRMSLE